MTHSAVLLVLDALACARMTRLVMVDTILAPLRAHLFDAGSGRIVQRVGLAIAARSTVIPFDAIEGIRIIPVVAGTIPGSADEATENLAALAGTPTVDSRGRRARHKKPFLDLVVECLDGTRYLIDHRPARCAAELREVANQLAALCDRPLEEG